ncbi:MAG: signal peptidase I [Hahellaceae bacterium]|nr:signal peptidase I [Hahellaceae bacterium]
MDIDFPLILVLLTLGTGLVWLADIFVLRAKRVAAVTGHSGAAIDSTGDSTEKKLGQIEEGFKVTSSPEKQVSEPWIVETSRSFFPVLAIVLILRSFLVEPFQIPSGSMLPTLEVGDFILVNKYAYGLRLPVAGTKVIAIGEPKRGDVMVFRYPGDRKTNYIKRIVGVPGDTIRYHDKTLYINGDRISEQHLANLSGTQLFAEQLGDVNHQIFKTQRVRGQNGEGEWVIPDGRYFVMGDNRDNSNDSRFWGLVPDELIVGKAFAIWMHWEKLFSLPSFSRVRTIE